MRDPHVDSLRYGLSAASGVTFQNPPAIEGDENDFKFRLSDSLLTVTLKSHFPTLETAKAVVAPFIRAWEIEQALLVPNRDYRFHFESGSVVDRNPPKPGEPLTVEAAAISLFMTAHDVTLHVGVIAYPNPPARFVVSPDVETLWQRFTMYEDGREPIMSMAYACSTLFERSVLRTNGVSAPLPLNTRSTKPS